HTRFSRDWSSDVCSSDLFAVTGSELFMGGLLATDVTFGPDGAMYVSDWVEGWPKSRRGRIYSITPIDPDPLQASLSAELSQIFRSEERRVGKEWRSGGRP